MRWYGETLGYIKKPVLEHKIKQGFLGRKEHFHLPAFYLDQEYGYFEFIKALENIELPKQLQLELKCLQPKLFNSYKRRYYLSADRRFRLTIDTDLKFASPNVNDRKFSWLRLQGRQVVVELKYSSSDKDDEEELEK